MKTKKGKAKSPSQKGHVATHGTPVPSDVEEEHESGSKKKAKAGKARSKRPDGSIHGAVAKMMLATAAVMTFMLPTPSEAIGMPGLINPIYEPRETLCKPFFQHELHIF